MDWTSAILVCTAVCRPNVVHVVSGSKIFHGHHSVPSDVVQWHPDVKLLCAPCPVVPVIWPNPEEKRRSNPPVPPWRPGRFSPIDRENAISTPRHNCRTVRKYHVTTRPQVSNTNGLISFMCFISNVQENTIIRLRATRLLSDLLVALLVCIKCSRKKKLTISLFPRLLWYRVAQRLLISYYVHKIYEIMIVKVSYTFSHRTLRNKALLNTHLYV